MPEYRYSFRDKKRLGQIDSELARIKKRKERGELDLRLIMAEQQLLSERENITKKVGE